MLLAAKRPKRLSPSTVDTLIQSRKEDMDVRKRIGLNVHTHFQNSGSFKLQTPSGKKKKRKIKILTSLAGFYEQHINTIRKVLSMDSIGSRAPPLCPQDFFKIMHFSSNFKGKTPILGSGPHLGVKILLPPLTKILDPRLMEQIETSPVPRRVTW